MPALLYPRYATCEWIPPETHGENWSDAQLHSDSMTTPSHETDDDGKGTEMFANMFIIL